MQARPTRLGARLQMALAALEATSLQLDDTGTGCIASTKKGKPNFKRPVWASIAQGQPPSVGLRQDCTDSC
jgi:hypothetical protein